MPIYEFACPACRVIFSFLSRRVNPGRRPVCPKCGHRRMVKQMSKFASPRVGKTASSAPEGEDVAPDMEDPRTLRAMAELEREMEHVDQTNPKHMAHVMKRMKDVMPAGTWPKEIDVAIKRLEAGEDPERIEEEMGDVLGDWMGDAKSGGGAGGSGDNYQRDGHLYDY